MMSVLFTPAGLTCCPLQLITPSWPWEGWPGVPSPLHPPSPSYYQIQPEGAECSVLTILTGKIGQVEETSYVIDWEVNTDPETLACDREVEAVFSSNNNSIIHSASNSSVFGSDNYSDSDDDDLSFTSVSCWTEEEEDVSCYCSAASSRSPSPPMSLLLQPLVKRMPLPPLPMPLLGKMSLPLRERMPMTQKQRMPMPPSIQDTMSLLDIVDRFQSFRLCTAV